MIAFIVTAIFVTGIILVVALPLEAASPKGLTTLLQTLADGPRPQVEVQAEAAKIHISIASLRRAKGDLGVKASKVSDHWEWSLPPRPEGDGSGGSSQDAQTPGGEYLEHLEHLQEKYSSK